MMKEVVNFVRRKVLARPKRHKRLQSPVNETAAEFQLIVVSHEASLTGAPKIILQLLQEFSSSPSIRCTTILHNGGPLAADFRKFSDVYCLDVKRKATRYLQRMVNAIVGRLPRNIPTVALVNSAESRFVAQALHARSIPIVSLIHEFPNSYSRDDFDMISRVSKSVIFPAQIVRDSAVNFASFRPGQALVVPQGLLDSSFGKRQDVERCRQQVRTELKIPSDARIVLGCGSLDLRKGFDLFANAAARFVRSHGDELNTHFVWLGEGIRRVHSAFHFVMIDVQKTGLEKNIHFIGERTDVEPYFTAADALLMVSREDPFPCVVHESMACGTPVIAFDKAGGAPEAIADGAGVVVPYGDCEAVSHQLYRLLSSSDYNHQVIEKAKERIRTHYDFKEYFATIDQMVQQTVGVDLREVPIKKAA